MQQFDVIICILAGMTVGAIMGTLLLLRQEFIHRRELRAMRELGRREGCTQVWRGLTAMPHKISTTKH